jgi:pyruvate/2-oxoglutarate/acetoin dehydrogenase E1 component
MAAPDISDGGVAAPETGAVPTGPITRIIRPRIPLPAADALGDQVIPSVDRITKTVFKAMESK